MNKAHVISHGCYSDWTIVSILIKENEIEGEFQRLCDGWIADNPNEKTGYLSEDDWLRKLTDYLKDYHGYVEYKFEDHNWDW